MRGVLAVAALSATLAAAAPSTAQEAPTAEYDITWRNGASPVAEVVATLTSQDCTIRSAEKWATFFESDRGWASQITQFLARDTAGHRLTATSVPRGWRLGDGACTVRVSYQVDFAFARRQWEAGNEQVAYVDDSGVYTTGLPLFLVGDESPARVRMHLPRNWRVASPLSQAGDQSVLEAANQTALLENTLVVGTPFLRTFEASGFRVTAALMGDMGDGGAVLADAFARIVPRYVALAPTMRARQYMFVVMPGPEDGEAYDSSFAVTTRAPPTAANRVIWANHLSHELLHHWIGHALRPSDADRTSMEWFTEGFTEYFANLTLAQQRILSTDEYLALLSRRLGTYTLTRVNPNFMEVTATDAGARKWRNRPIVYDGGAAIAFCLDTRIRQLSANRRGLEDVLRSLLQQQEVGQALTYDGVVAASSAAAGADLSDFFARYVRGTETLPVEQCARDAGLNTLSHGYDVYLSRAAQSNNDITDAIQRTYLGE